MSPKLEFKGRRVKKCIDAYNPYDLFYYSHFEQAQQSKIKQLIET